MYKVVFFGMLGYKVLSEHESQSDAFAELQNHRRLARAGRYAVAGYTRDAHEHDFDVRTQDDLDALTKAIHDSYNY